MDTPLHSAVSENCLDIVKLFLERTDIDPNKDNRVRRVVFNRTVKHKSALTIKSISTQVCSYIFYTPVQYTESLSYAYYQDIFAN